MKKVIGIFKVFHNNNRYLLLIFCQNFASRLLSSWISKNCTLALILISGNTPLSTEIDLSTLESTWRFSKSEKYLPIESTTDDKMSYLISKWMENYKELPALAHLDKRI